MPHVSDGDIHVYLDGALDLYPPEEAERIRVHLASCADCTARLEVERAVRGRAEEILSGSGPGVIDAPPFEELRARVAPSGASGSGRRGWPLSPTLAWAASLALAAAVGWAGRGVLVPPDARAPVSAVDALEPLGGVSADAGSGDAAQPRRELAETQSGEAEPTRELEVTSSEDAAAPAALEPAPVSPSPAEQKADAERLERSRTQPSPPAVVAVDESVERPGDSLAAAAGGEAPLPGLAGRRADLAVPTSGTEERDAADLSVRPAAAPAEAASFRDVATRGALDQRVAGQGFLIPGLEVRSVDLAPPPNPPGAIRVVQILPGGEPVELIRGDGPPPEAPSTVEEAGADRLASAANAQASVTRVLEMRDGGWILASGPVSADSLRSLIRSIR